MRERENITGSQLFFLTVQTQIGIGVLSLPYAVHQTAKGDSWISVLIAGVLVQIFISLFWWLNKLYPKDDVFMVARKCFGKTIGKLVSLLYFAYFLLVAYLILTLFGDVLSRWLFPKTPSWLILLLFVLICSYLANENLHVIARFYSFTFLLGLLLVFILIPAAQKADVRYILPIGQSGLTDIAKGVNNSITSMLGFETLLLTLPALKTRKKGYRALVLGNLFVTFIYVFVVLVTIMSFSPAELRMIPEPVLYMLKSFQLTIIDRIDIFFLSIWIVSVATSFILYLHSSAVGLANLIQAKGHKHMTLVCSILLSIVLFLPKKLIDQDKLTSIVELSSYLFIIIIPLLLLLFALVKNKLKTRREAVQDV